MRDEVGEGTMRRFIATYLDLLGPRLERIAKPLERGRADGARAAFDLRVGSQMLGAARLAELAGGFEQAFRDGLVAGSRQTARLRREADAVAGALSGMLNTVEGKGSL
jgi:hypothetical protein